ncbi:MAG: YutD-like domain-containing protein [Candidatus Coprovivens sp.]
MKKTLVINDVEYEIINDYNDAIDKIVLSEKITDYFDNFDYIVGDWAYGKLRLKGFYDSNNKSCKKINDIATLKTYIENNCAYGCKWFQIKRIK